MVFELENEVAEQYEEVAQSSIHLFPFWIVAIAIFLTQGKTVDVADFSFACNLECLAQNIKFLQPLVLLVGCLELPSRCVGLFFKLEQFPFELVHRVPILGLLSI